MDFLCVTPKPTTIMDLNEEQQLAVRYASEGYSIFLTGAAGTGKTFTLRKIIEAIEERDRKVHVTASTGIAATLLGEALNGGVQTFHGWASIGLGKYPVDSHARFIVRNKRALQRIRETDVVVLDEVSMMDDEYMQKVDEVMRAVRGNGREPFGGIQMIFTGDFYQLPPTQKNVKEPRYLFESEVWRNTVEKTIMLHQVYRQASREFVGLLDKVRTSSLDEGAITVLRGLEKTTFSEVDRIKPTTLYCRNVNVDAMNATELKRLPGKTHKFSAKSFFKTEAFKKEFGNSFNMPEHLYLKVDAQVMCLVNQDTDLGIVNGSRGVVTEITEESVAVRFANGNTYHFTPQKRDVVDENGLVVAWQEQFPLNLSWAMTIHKSQGATIDLLDVDLAGCWLPGQAYVALSRAKDMSNLKVRNFRTGLVITNPKVKEFYKSLSKKRERE